VADLDRRAAMSPDQRQRLEAADQLIELAVTLHRQGKYADGIDPCRNAMEIRGELLGQGHPDYATSLDNLDGLYRALGYHARAKPLYREATAIWKKALGEGAPRLRHLPQQPGQAVPGPGRLRPRRASPPRGDGDHEEGRGNEKGISRMALS
jgi:hypothetical protein